MIPQSITLLFLTPGQSKKTKILSNNLFKRTKIKLFVCIVIWPLPQTIGRLNYSPSQRVKINLKRNS